MKLTSKEENELISFIKDWLKIHGYSQKDLATNLNINSSRTIEIIKKIKDLHKKGGFFNVAKKLIEIEQKWIKNSTSLNNPNKYNHLNNQKNQSETQSGSYSQLDLDYKVDIDLLMNKMEKDFKE
tara:strand:+ start:166 stop:540 length:375 start_codon:yes stop_codon:yes gene_type:complete